MERRADVTARPLHEATAPRAAQWRRRAVDFLCLAAACVLSSDRSPGPRFRPPGGRLAPSRAAAAALAAWWSCSAPWFSRSHGFLMGKIIWLASYPKSGNTWVRAFLHNLMRDTPEAYDINRLSDLTLGDSQVRWFQQIQNKPSRDFKIGRAHV